MSSTTTATTEYPHDQMTATSLWHQKAEEWNSHVGLDGDLMRTQVTDVVLWQMIDQALAHIPLDGHIKILDAGCGNGYFLGHMAERLSSRCSKLELVGVDAASGMVECAKRNLGLLDNEQPKIQSTNVQLKVLEGSISELELVLGQEQSKSFDLIVSSFVLMDVSDLEGTIASFEWALKSNTGHCALVFSHPFLTSATRRRYERESDAKSLGIPPNMKTEETTQAPSYHDPNNYYAEALLFERSYFESRARIEKWGSFSSEFLIYHRPLCEYSRVFKKNSFAILELLEPYRSESDFIADGIGHKFVRNCLTPQPIAFLLRLLSPLI